MASQRRDRLSVVAPIVPDPRKIKSFRSEAAFEAWMKVNHARETEIWVKIHKKGSGLPTVTNAQALDVALCWGWIDGIRKGFDERSFLQRYTPRRARSIWSQINRDHVKRLEAAGRMTPQGQRQVDAAKADGRWDAAYAPMRSASEATIPAGSPRGHRGEPAGAEDVPHAPPSEPVRTRLSNQQHENARRARAENRGAGRHALARRDHHPRAAAALRLFNPDEAAQPMSRVFRSQANACRDHAPDHGAARRASPAKYLPRSSSRAGSTNCACSRMTSNISVAAISGRPDSASNTTDATP